MEWMAQNQEIGKAEEETQTKKKGSYQSGYDRGIERYGFPHNHLLGPQLQHSAQATLDLVVWQAL